MLFRRRMGLKSCCVIGPSAQLFLLKDKNLSSQCENYFTPKEISFQSSGLPTFGSARPISKAEQTSLQTQAIKMYHEIMGSSFAPNFTMGLPRADNTHYFLGPQTFRGLKAYPDFEKLLCKYPNFHLIHDDWTTVAQCLAGARVENIHNAEQRACFPTKGMHVLLLAIELCEHPVKVHGFAFFEPLVDGQLNWTYYATDKFSKMPLLTECAAGKKSCHCHGGEYHFLQNALSVGKVKRISI